MAVIAKWLLVALAAWWSVTGDSRGVAEPPAESGRQPSGSETPGTGQSEPPAGEVDRSELAAVVRQAFAATHDGWSTDEVLVNDELNAAFLAACRRQLPQVTPAQCNWMLLNLRKAGKLGVKATRRRHDRHDEYLHAAEIAARYVYDKYHVSVDRALCVPKYRREFDRVARSAAPDVPAYRLRKAALGLRKARRLRPELVVRIADWGRQVIELPAERIVQDPSLVPAAPGVYIFRDRTGYLYIGESSDLRRRVTKHLDHSDRKSLAHYLWEHGVRQITIELHVFDPESRAKSRTVRRAYESELIRSRKPRFNIAP